MEKKTFNLVCLFVASLLLLVATSSIDTKRSEEDLQELRENGDFCTGYKTTYIKYPVDCSIGNPKLPPGRKVHKNVRYDRIFMGKKVPKAKFPSIMKVIVNKKQDRWEQCSGWILTDRIVVTSGSCLFEASAAYVKAPYTNYIGTLNNTLCLHPKMEYQLAWEKYNRWDMGIVVLEKPIKLDEYTQPACLVKRQGTLNGALVGVGVFERGSSYSPVPLEIPIRRETDDEKCFKNIGKGSLMCFDVSSTEYCSGDEGGPIFGTGENAGEVIGMTLAKKNECSSATSKDIHFGIDVCEARDEILNLADKCFNVHLHKYPPTSRRFSQSHNRSFKS